MKKGFTLIELLAVIVILAIIALIATPIVLDIIADTKKSAAERTADNYIKQVENAIATANLENKLISNGTYKIEKDGNICPLAGCGENDKDKIKVKMNGEKPKGGSIVISNGQVTTDSSIIIGDYTIAYNPTNKKYEATEKGSSSILCKANTTKATALVYNSGSAWEESSYKSEEVGLLASEATSKYDVGVTYTCELGNVEERTFYVLETSGDNVSLIMSENLGDKIAWITKEDYLAAGGTEDDWNTVSTDYGNNNLGPITANKVLKERTSGWTKLDEAQITLPSGQQIATAGGDTKWTGSSYTGTSLPTWLYSHTKFTTGAYGYWTSSPSAFSDSVWSVYYEGYLNYFDINVSNSNFYGIRPVITIPKSQLD